MASKSRVGRRRAQGAGRRALDAGRAGIAWVGAIDEPPQDPRPRYASGRLKPTAEAKDKKAKAEKVRLAAQKAKGTGRYSAEAKAKRNKAKKVRRAAHKTEGTGRYSAEAKAKKAKAENIAKTAAVNMA